MSPIGRRAVLLGAALALACGIAQAMTMSTAATAGAITVDGAWARPTVGSSRQGVIYLTITNTGAAPDRLLSASTPAAESAELHTMTMDGGMMKMRAIPAITIPAEGTVALAPGGDHIMLIGVAPPLRKGDDIALALIFETAGELEVSVPVLDGPPEPMSH